MAFGVARLFCGGWALFLTGESEGMQDEDSLAGLKPRARRASLACAGKSGRRSRAETPWH